MTVTEEAAESTAAAPAFGRKVLVAVAGGALALGLLLGGILGAVLVGGDEAPQPKPATGQPLEQREGPDSAELDEDAFAPVGEVGAEE